MYPLRLAAGFALACALLLFTGCNEPTSPTGVVSLTSTDLIVGSGDTVNAGSKVTVNYTVWLYDPSGPNSKGAQVDTSIGHDPLTVTLGTGSVIKGWDQGLVGMRVGGVRRLVVPPSLGYGSERHNAIPPYSTLVFDIELIAIG